jgi:hypothetical protein
MKLQHLKQLVLQVHKAFPDAVPKCERGLIRSWDGCVYYLLQFPEFLMKVCRRNGSVCEAPVSLEAVKVTLPSIDFILSKIAQSV